MVFRGKHAPEKVPLLFFNVEMFEETLDLRFFTLETNKQSTEQDLALKKLKMIREWGTYG